ncbi:hypothetical protein [Alkalicoccus luteus]|uniref:Uncharacterized protein n=1 Tax=Alkalicoccus luteus TaxID=1237094 RepID=A0A969Q1I7_9BACI|nr:hypothetical protein [Alkalicoccus luteus]NJP39377.1 hypothetical protein [Alkalicoccus luteus]
MNKSNQLARLKRLEGKFPESRHYIIDLFKDYNGSYNALDKELQKKKYQDAVIVIDDVGEEE